MSGPAGGTGAIRRAEPTPILSAAGLGKRYRLGTGDPYKTIRESLMRLISSRGGGNSRPERPFLWALRDLSFDVSAGEVVGVVGRNGAGKTTLLKILSRVTEPTEGRVELRGRVASLLEVGTGFHPELTGRENIYLNGGILGMRRREIAAKFDEIVAFAETEAFLDTPVKRYSSGMYVRLAFAVAAHLEPEILLVDEVLSVGDAAFQKKCLGRMSDVSRQGRTVLFVSHNLQAVRTLCPRSILLEGGRIEADGPTGEVLARYGERIRETAVDEETAVGNDRLRRGEGSVRISSFSLADSEGRERFDFAMGETVRFEISCRVFRPMRGLSLYLALRSGRSGEIITSAGHVITEEPVGPGMTGRVTLELPQLAVRPGEYPLYVQVSEAVYTRTNFDLLDGLTAPLVVTAGEEEAAGDFDPSYSVGYFSIPSKIVNREISPAGGREIRER